MPTRREFLRHLAVVSTVLTDARIWSGTRSPVPACTGGRKGANGKRTLVLVELAGGCDGLNTLVPYRNDFYYAARPNLAIRKAQGVLTLNDTLGLHPTMAGLKELWDAGMVGIVQAVGYPGAQSTHFLARQVWHTAQTTACTPTHWLQAAMDRTPKLGSQRETGQSSPRQANCLPYSATALAGDLRTIAEHVPVEPHPSVFLLSIEGFDTHAHQVLAGNSAVGPHAALLEDLSQSLQAFHADLTARACAKEVLVVVFSEFGRRLDENQSLGTDHGAANPVLLIGGGVNPGVYGEPPGLSPQELDENGRLVHKVDFRSVYSALLKDWLKVDAEPFLQNRWADPRLSNLLADSTDP